jgi:hypothetical protein
MKMETQLQPADIFLTRGSGLISRAIRFFSRSIGESRTKVNHVGVVVGEGQLQDALVVEALSRVKRHTLWEQYGPLKKDLVAVYRPLNLTPDEAVTIVKEANEQVGKKYGYIKIIAHLLDWLLLGVYFFRRFANNGKYPICSWLVAHAYSKAGKYFGCEPDAAEPDDIWDFVNKNTDKYKEIYHLRSIWKENPPGHRIE